MSHHLECHKFVLTIFNLYNSSLIVRSEGIITYTCCSITQLTVLNGSNILAIGGVSTVCRVEILPTEYGSCSDCIRI